MAEKPGVYSFLSMLLFILIMSFFISAKKVSNDWSLLKLPTVWVPKLDITVSAFYITWFGIQCLLYLLPFGGDVVQGSPGRQGHRFSYRLNGFFVLTVNVAGFFVAHLCGFKVSVIADKTWELTSIAFFFPFALSVVLLLTTKLEDIPSYNVNPDANAGNILQDWLLGKTLNPRIGFLDIKLVTFRSTVIAIILYQFGIVAKFYEVHNSSNFCLLLSVGMQLLYLSDSLWFEWIIINLKEISKDGCGAIILMMGASIAIQCGVSVNIIAEYNIRLPWYCLLVIAVIFSCGYCTYRLSNDEKYRYRQNPNAPEFKDYEVVSTARGTNLLVSGWWGMCRHPNYLGDIIMNTAMAMPSGWSFAFAYYNPLMITLVLMDRENDDSKECKKKYGDDWDTYCHRVKYRLIPGIY